MQRLVPIEVATSHSVFDVPAFAVRFTHDVQVTVGSVLQPQLALCVVAPETLVCNKVPSVMSPHIIIFSTVRTTKTNNLI